MEKQPSPLRITGNTELAKYVSDTYPSLKLEKLQAMKDNVDYSVLKLNGASKIKTELEQIKQLNKLGVPKYKDTSRYYKGTTNPVSFSEDDLQELKKVIFSEVNRRVDSTGKPIIDKNRMEVEIVANVALNRLMSNSKEFYDVENTLFNVVRKKGAFQGYGTPEYEKASLKDKDLPSKEKEELIDDVIDKIRKGELEDITGGALFYRHTEEPDINKRKIYFYNTYQEMIKHMKKK